MANKNLVIKIDVDGNGVTSAFKVMQEEAGKVKKAVETIGSTQAIELLKKSINSIAPALQQQNKYLQEFQAKLDKLNASTMPEILKPSSAARSASAYDKKLSPLLGQIQEAIAQLNLLDRKLANTIGLKLGKDFTGGANLKQTLITQNAGSASGEQADAWIAAAKKQQEDRLKEISLLNRTLGNAETKGLEEWNKQSVLRDENFAKNLQKFEAEQIAKRAKQQQELAAFHQQANANIVATGIDPAGLQHRQRQSDIEEAFRRADERNAQVERRLQAQSEARQNRIISARTALQGTGQDTQQIQLEVARDNAIRIDGERSYRARRAEYALQSFNAERRLEEQLASIRTQAASGTLRAPQATTQRNAAMASYREALGNLPDLNEPIRQHQSLFLRVGALTAAYRILNTAISTVTSGITSIPKVGIELDAARASLEATMGSVAGAESALKALNAEANRTGINISTLRQNFAGFQASTSLAGASLESTWGMFTNLNTVITGLHLTADKANGVFLAMAQIFNKGRVQSEELVKQLGNLLPGAFASFAASMDILPSELSRRMKAGMVMANDVGKNGKTVMENFIQFYTTKFAPAFAVASQGVNANFERMDTSFTHLGEAIYARMQPSLLSVIKTITSVTDSITGLVNGTNQMSDAMSATLAAASVVATTGLVGLALQIGSTTVVAKGLQVVLSSFSPLAAGITLVATAFGLIATKAMEASKNVSAVGKAYEAQKAAEDKIRAEADARKTPTTLDVALENDPAYATYNKQLNDLKKQRNNSTEKVKSYSQSNPLLESAKLLPEFLLNRAENVSNKFGEPAANFITGIGNLTIPSMKQKHLKELADNDKDLEVKITADRDKAAKRVAEEFAETEKERKKTLDTQQQAALDEANLILKKTEVLEAPPKSAEEARLKAIAKYAKDWKDELKAAKEKVALHKEFEARKAKATAEGIPFGEKWNELPETHQANLQTIANIEQGRQPFIDSKVKEVTDSLASKAKIATSQEARVDFKENERDIRSLGKTTKEQLSSLDTLYKDNKLSIYTYYADTLNIQLQALDKKKALYEQERQVAFKANNDVKAADLLGRISDIEAEKETAKENIIQKKTADLDAYNQQLQQVLAEEQKLKGNLVESALTTYKEAHKDFLEKAQLTANYQGNDPEMLKAKAQALAGIGAVKTGETHAGYNASLSEIEKSSNLIMKQHTERRQTIDSMRESGAYSPMFAQMQLMKENKQVIEDYTRELEKAQEEQDKLIAKGEKPAEQDQLRMQTLKSQLTMLKKESQSMSDTIVNNMGKAFDSSFANLITGASGGRMAFRQFAISVEQDLANIAAAEIRSAIFNSLGLTSATGVGGGGLLKMLGGAFTSVLGGVMGSGLGMSGSASQNAALSKSILATKTTGTMFANGGMLKSSDLSQYSGSLVSSPTLFKFANGSNTGLMGEAGAEFILPAAKMANGKMGVRAVGGNTGSNVAIKNINITVQQAANATPAQQGEVIATHMRKHLVTLIQQQTANNLRSGNLLNPTQMQVGL